MRFLVSGGAGFIGSHIASFLLANGASKVFVLDNLAGGTTENLAELRSDPALDFIEDDINNGERVGKICREVDVVFHQAALGSVPRSFSDPLSTHEANANGFLSVLDNSHRVGVKKFIYASSSSVYGDSTDLPKTEEKLGKPKSPYAVTKLMNESYASLYSKHSPTQITGLRYFNIFGPRQRPDGPYAAAIPIFINAAIRGEKATVYGDGTQSRDFTYVENAVMANMKALFAEKDINGRVYNIACGEKFSLNEVLDLIAEVTGEKIDIEYADFRQGDILESMADISKARKELEFEPSVALRAGLEKTIQWYREKLLQLKS